MSRGTHELSVAIDLVRAEREGTAGIQRRQLSRFNDLVSYARARSPFYREHYRGLPDIPGVQDLPPVSKPELMARFDEWVTDPRITLRAVREFLADSRQVGEDFLGEFFVCTTSGTTGRPGIFVHDHDAVVVYRAFSPTRIGRRWLPPSTWPAMVAHRMRWASVVGTGGHFAGAAWMQAERRRGGWRRRAYATFSVQEPLPQLVAGLNAFQPAILTSYPSALDLLAAQQEAGRLDIAPVMIEAAGESLLPEKSRRAQRAFGAPVRQAYAASEALVIAIGCDHGWQHVNADWMLLEPVDAELQPTPLGEQSQTVLLTNLANRIQPIIRYDLGDSVTMRPDPCPCGNPLPAIRVGGRSNDIMHLPDRNGAPISILPLAVSQVAEQTPGVFRFQLIQSAPSRIDVRIEPEAGADREAVWAALSARLREFLESQGAVGCEIVLSPESPQSTAAGKFQQVMVQMQ